VTVTDEKKSSAASAVARAPGAPPPPDGLAWPARVRVVPPSLPW